MDLRILKIGGSLITEKDTFETKDGEMAEDVASELEAEENLILVHGAGSFGHPHAEEYGLDRETGTRDAGSIVETRDAVCRLNSWFVTTLHDRGIDAVPLHPFSMFHKEEGCLRGETDHIESMLREGFTPVLHGDLVTYDGEGATVLSGDEVAAYLADDLDADRLGYCSSVPGVLDSDGDVVRSIRDEEGVERYLEEGNDASGGLRGKVETVLRYDVVASIFGMRGLEDFLGGDRPGTVIGQ